MNKEVKYIEESITFRELATRLGIDDLDTPEEYDIRDEGYEILSFDETSGKEVWKPLEAYVVKKNASEHYQLNTLHGTADHRVLLGDKYVRLAEHPGAELVKAPIQVIDCQVADTQNYIAEGQVNHNTTTSGGMAIPYASSVRIRLDGGTVVKDKHENTIGINLTAKTIKNKVGKPFRKCAFQLIFGYGIVEHEEIFDVLREYCAESGPAKMEDSNITVEVSGAAAWKNFLVKDTVTGEIHADVKFNKADFGTKVLENPEYTKYVKALMDAAYIQRGVSHPTFIGPDMNSDEEAKAVALEQAEKELEAN